MPEGDTIFRTATSMRKWIEGREVTAVRTKVRGLQLERITGTTVEAVEPRAKHLLIRFSNKLVLHTHMRMTGSWHLYTTGERWKKPQWQAKLSIDCGDRQIVCFNAPVVELLMPSDERAHRSLQGLGPDVLGDYDQVEMLRRARAADQDTLIGELILDQRVVGGIGNIYRCESLFMERIDPYLTTADVTDEQLTRVVETARRLMRLNAGVGGDKGRVFEAGGPDRPWVYNRTRRACRVCGSPIKAGRLGKQARDVYWCPQCQGQGGGPERPER